MNVRFRLQTVQQMLAVLCALLVAAPLFAQQNNPPVSASQQTPAGQPATTSEATETAPPEPEKPVLGGPGATPFGQLPFDASITTSRGVVFIRYLKSWSEVRTHLRANRTLVPSGAPDLLRVKERLITRWGLDPVVKVPNTLPVQADPIQSIPPTERQLEQLDSRVDENQFLADTQKNMLKRAYRDPNLCVQHTGLVALFGEEMVNGSAPIWNFEVAPELARKTNYCSIALEDQVVDLIFYCGNLSFPYQIQIFGGPPVVAKAPETRCVELATNANGSYMARFDGPVGAVVWILQQQGGGQQLVLPGTVSDNIASLVVAPSQNLNPNATYSVSLKAFTPQGNGIDVSACTAQNAVFTTPPPAAPSTVTTTTVPPLVINNTATGGNASVKGGHGKWIALALVIAGAAVGAGLAFGKKSNTNVNVTVPGGATKSCPGQVNPTTGACGI